MAEQCFRKAEVGGSSPLSGSKKFMRVRGIGPRSIAWEAIILPLNHTRLFNFNLLVFPIKSRVVNFYFCAF